MWNLGNWWIQFSYMYDPIKNEYRSSFIYDLHPSMTEFTFFVLDIFRARLIIGVKDQWNLTHLGINLVD